MAAKNIILQMKLENELKDLMVRSGADNIIVNSETQETLATRLASIAAQIGELQAGEGGVSKEDVQQIVNTAIDNLIGSAPDTYDTLQEIAAYIETHEDAFAALNAAIGNKVDKVDGKGLSTNDFTNELLAKLNSISEGATKTEKSVTNGNIKINGTETVVYTHPTGDGYNHLPSGGTVGQILRAGGSGAGQWGSNVRSGVSEPSDLAEGELFIKLLN